MTNGEKSGKVESVMNILDCKASIRERFSGTVEILENVPTKKITTFGLGVPVPLLLEPNSVSALQELVSFLKERGVPWFVLGAGSNTVFPDAPLQKAVIRLGREFDKACFYKSIQDVGRTATEVACRDARSCVSARDSARVSAEPGENMFALAYAKTSLMNLSAVTCAKGLSGLEFGGGIPASIGGAVLINAGAHGWDIGSVTEEVWYLDNRGEVVKLGKGNVVKSGNDESGKSGKDEAVKSDKDELVKSGEGEAVESDKDNVVKSDNDELEFSYRYSNLPRDCIVLAAVLKLTKQDVAEVQAKRQQGLDYRKKNQPISMPSAGSIFRNPSGGTTPAGKLIDDAGLKGFRIGSCEVSRINANWIVRVAEEGRQSDLLEIMQVVRDRVQEKFGVTLESEVVIVEAI